MTEEVSGADLTQLTTAFANQVGKIGEVERSKLLDRLDRHPKTTLFNENSISCTDTGTGGIIREGVVHRECHSVKDPSKSARVSIPVQPPLAPIILGGRIEIKR